jgi:uncharacterized protein
MRRKEREITKKELIEEIIKKADVCRIAMANNNIPYVVTMNFGYSGGDHPILYFHCAPVGRKLEMIKKNNYVCFEMDTDHQIYEGENGCDWGMKYSSVVGFGKISVLIDKKERVEGLSFIMAHYSDRNDFTYEEKTLERTTILKLDIEEMTGKRI